MTAYKKIDVALPCSAILRERGISYWDLAHLSGVSTTTVAATIKYGKRNAKVLAAISGVLSDMTAEELFGSES